MAYLVSAIFLLILLSALLFLLFHFLHQNAEIEESEIGEQLLFNRLSKYAKDDCILLQNCYLPSKNGGTTEIDLMMLCRNGIFVFENKSLEGWIYGHENDLHWSVTNRYRGKLRKKEFFNPVRQNDIHITALKHLLEDYDFPVFSIIVFSGECEFKDVKVESDGLYCIKLNEVCNLLDQIMLDTDWHLERSSIRRLGEILQARCNVSSRVRRKHDREMKRYQK